jgi:uncharacterized protein (TIGR03437 family)
MPRMGTVQSGFLVLGLCSIASGFVVSAQPVTTVENLGSVPAAVVKSSLGFNITSTNEWEYPMAANAGATEGRMGFSWDAVENMAGVLSLSAADETALNWCAKYGLSPLLVAAYGPPRQKILTLTVSGATPSGSLVIPVREDVSTITVPYCHLQKANGDQIVPEGKWAYYGALIGAVDTANRTITLAAASNVAFAAGDKLVVNQLRYVSVPSTDPKDASIAAYARYVQYLANRIDAHGLTGRVEIWNEPPWAHDPWETRYRFYDKPPSNLEQPSIQFGFAALLQTTKAPGTVRYNWAGPQKSGFNSLLGSRMSPHPTQDQVANSISSESFHPYSDAPEDPLWDPACLADLSIGDSKCSLEGASGGSSLKSAVRYNLANQASNGWTIEQNITETGLPTSNQVAKARWILRQFLGFHALGIHRINFYRLADSGGNYGFIDSDTQTPLPAYLAIKGLMGDVAAIAQAPVPYTPSDLPAVTSYKGYYPLTTATIVGTSTPGDTANSVLFTCWQRSYPASGNWQDLPSPSPVPVTVTLPGNVAAQYAYNLTTRVRVPIGVVDSQVTFNVADDPVGLLVTPTASAPGPTISAVVNGASFTAGVSAGSWVTILGTQLSTTTRQWNADDFVAGNLPVKLDGVSVKMNGIPAYPYYISPSQLNVLAPDDGTTGPVQVQVTNAAGMSNALTVSKSAATPAFFLFTQKYPAAVHLSGAGVGPAGLIAGGNFAPAAPGETIQLFGTGFGPTNPPSLAGKILSVPAPLASNVTVTIGGLRATVTFAGLSGNGLDQLNVTVPAGLPNGDASIVAAAGGASTQANLFLTIQH